MNNIEPKYIKSANIIIFDEENIKYISGGFTEINYKNVWDSGMFANGKTYHTLLGTDINIPNAQVEETETIKLDETLMKRIAKYNKEAEIKKLDEIIKSKNEKIKELDDKLQDKEQRWDKVKEYIAGIYDLDLNDYDENDDYDDYDY
jgi:ribosomal protein S3